MEKFSDSHNAFKMSKVSFKVYSFYFILKNMLQLSPLIQLTITIVVRLRFARGQHMVLYQEKRDHSNHPDGLAWPKDIETP